MEFSTKTIRKQAQPLTVEFVFSKVSPQEVFEKYYGSIKLGKKYPNLLTNSSKANCEFFIARDRNLLLKDFSTDEVYSAVKFVMEYHHCDFKTALRTIANNFAIERRTIQDYARKATLSKKDTLIQIRVKPFTRFELKYWEQFGITHETLKKFNVYSVGKLWINKNYRTIFPNRDPVFAYHFPKTNRLKIYKPLAKKKGYKWRSNLDSLEDINGLDQCPFSPEYITSSLKDVMTLYEAGYTSIAPQSEVISLPPLIEKAITKDTILLYDNDEVGINKAKKCGEKYDLRIKILQGAKDPSDFVKKFGLNKLKDELRLI